MYDVIQQIIVPAPASSARANADGTRRSAQASPKHASKPEGEDRSSRRPWSSKSKISPDFESKPEEHVEDQSKRGSPKRKSKSEVRVEARRSRRSKCQDHKWITKKVPRSYLIRKIEYLHPIFGLSWFQQTGVLDKFVCWYLQDQNSTTRKLQQENLPDLQSWTFWFNFWVEPLFIPIINMSIIENQSSVICVVRTQTLFW